MKKAVTDIGANVTSATAASDIWTEIARAMSRVWLGSDLVIALILTALATCASYRMAQLIDPVVVDYATLDLWFDGDLPRNFVDMNQRDSELYTTRRHPLLPLLEFPPVYILKRAFGVEPLTAVRMTLAGVAALWVTGTFIVLRLIGCRRLDALVFTLLAMSSAAAVFWLVVPETPNFGSLSILPAIGVAALAGRRPVSVLWHVAASAASLSVTVTNWMFGLAASLVHYRRKRAVQITINAFCIVVLLWAAQRIIFPNAVFFFGSFDVVVPEPESGGPLAVLSSFIFHTIVMSSIKTTHSFYHPNLAVMTVQASWPGSASVLGMIAAVSWMALLGLGVWGWRIINNRELQVFLGLCLLGQIVLHLFIGRETFLYSLHFAPLLIALAALSSFTPARPVGLLLAGVVTIFGGINNGSQFEKATDLVRSQRTENYLVRTAMNERPLGPWPRGTGHIVLAETGSPAFAKAYHEPGGSFSPAVGSFGVSIWLKDTQGNLKAASDTLPASLFHQQLLWRDRQLVPALLTDASDYRALWSIDGPGHWLLNFMTQASPSVKPSIAIRSVGPAGGPIQSLRWDGQDLLVNDRWKVTVRPQPRQIYIGEEGPSGWIDARSEATRWSGKSGWGYARFDLVGGQAYTVSVTDSASRPIGAGSFSIPQWDMAVELPDNRFTESLRAQVAHLLMGLVGHETRPGDPMSYPFAWLRDEAYIVVALARSGQLQVAKELSKHLAENDFFGGFGNEADAPGLAIWALNQVAMQLREPAYDRWVWPHIQRKAALIAEMLSSHVAIHKPVRTPVIPLYTKPLPSADPDVSLVAEPARDGLIVGRIHNSRPLLYVNAVSHLGLINGAALADRLGQPIVASGYRSRARDLQQAWLSYFKKNPIQTFTGPTRGLWPAGVANPQRDSFATALEAQWNNAVKEIRRNSSRDYIEIADAHQWLLLGREDRAYTALAGLWDHQTSQGLYSWGVESSRENTPSQWKNTRVWFAGNEDHDKDGYAVMPSYRTAAEILLLQLDMLAYVDQTAEEPTIVIGAGVQPAWIAQPMSVRNLSTSLGRIDWTWNGRQISVTVRGSHAPVQFGPAWPVSTPLKVNYAD
jgi:hypothetical protein